MKAAVYVRVSNGNQSVEMQVQELHQYAACRGWEVVEYTDRGHSGARESRPALDRLMGDARRRRFDAVLVWRFDRFSRSLRQLVNSLEEFRSLGIDFVSLHEGVDTSTANGRLVFGIFASIAEFERELIRDRVRSGLAAAKARGQTLGRPRRRVDRGKIARLQASGHSVNAISKALKVSRGTITRALPPAPKA